MIDLLIVAGMIDRKFFSKVLPLMKSNQVRQIYVVRRKPVSGDKLRCFSPPKAFRNILLLAEIYRVLCIVYILLIYRPRIVIGIGLILHGIYTNLLGTLFRKKKILLLMGKNDLALTYPQRKVLQSVLLKVASLADFIGTRGSRSRAWLIKQGVDVERVFVPNNVFNFDQFVPAPRNCKVYDLIYVGRLSTYKRIDLLLTVFHILIQKGSANLRLAIVGEGRLKQQLVRQSQKLGIRHNISFLPAGNGSYVSGLLQKARVFVMTSQGEGLPMAVVEALSCSLPVVIFDDADVGDIVRHGENGFICTLGDVKAFTSYVKLLLEDQELYDRLSQNARLIRQERRSDYSVEKVRTTWEDVLCGVRQSVEKGISR